MESKSAPLRLLGVVVAVAGAPPGVLSVRLVDEHTGEPIPRFALELSDRRDRFGPPEPHETGEDGRFHSLREWRGAPALRVGLSDVEGAPWYGAGTFTTLLLEGRDPGEELTLAIVTGPTYTLDVDLPPGPTDVGVVLASALPVVGEVSGVLRSASGTYAGGCHVGLWPVDRALDWPPDESVDWEEDAAGELVAPFRFEDVRAGEYHLYVHCHDGSDWSDVVPVVTPPVEGVVITLPDDPAWLEVELVDAGTGAPLSDATLAWRLFDEEGSNGGPRARAGPFPRDFDGAALTRLAFADGYRPARGDGAVLSPSDAVQLRRDGWERVRAWGFVDVDDRLRPRAPVLRAEFWRTEGP